MLARDRYLLWSYFFQLLQLHRVFLYMWIYLTTNSSSPFSLLLFVFYFCFFVLCLMWITEQNNQIIHETLNKKRLKKNNVNLKNMGQYDEWRHVRFPLPLLQLQLLFLLLFLLNITHIIESQNEKHIVLKSVKVKCLRSGRNLSSKCGIFNHT